MSPPHMLTYMTYSNIIYQGFPYFFLEKLWEFLLQYTGPPYNGNIFFHLYTLDKNRLKNRIFCKYLCSVTMEKEVNYDIIIL